MRERLRTAVQPVIVPPLPHPKILGRRAAVAVLAARTNGDSPAEALVREILAPLARHFVRAWLNDLVVSERRKFDRKCLKRRRQARARCGRRA